MMKSIRRALSYAKNFTIFRRNFWFLLIIGLLAWHWLSDFSSLTSEKALVQRTLSITTLFCTAGILLFSLATTFPPYLMFLFRNHILNSDKGASDSISIEVDDSVPGLGSVNIRPKVKDIAKPFFGELRLRIIFDDREQTDPMTLDRSWKEDRRARGRTTSRRLQLPMTRDYRLSSVIIHFVDFFHLFAFPYQERETSGFYTEPAKTNGEAIPIEADRSDDPVLRVIQQKVSKGEMIDYKKYAPGDDIRRIIWKNYARNRELTVRIPERNFPYVSHINVLACFYDRTPGDHSMPVKQYLLNIYKEKLRQIVDSIIEQDFSVKYHTDQVIDKPYELDEYDNIIYSISTAEWQDGMTPEAFLRENAHKLRTGSNVFVFSSLCPVDEIKRTQGSSALNGFNLCFYNVSETFQRIKRPGIMKRLLLTGMLEPMDEAKRKISARKTVRFIRKNDVSIEEIAGQKNQPVIQV